MSGLLGISVFECENHTYFCSSGPTAYGFNALLELQRETVIPLLTSTSTAEEWPAQPVSPQNHGLIHWAEPSQGALSHSVNQLEGRNYQRHERL